MNALDLVLLALAVVYALSGYRQGFLVGSASTIGLLVGGFIGVRVTPALLDRFDERLSISVAALLIVLACAFVGQLVGVVVGSQIRSRITWQPARILDALGGGALSVVAMLLIAWVLGVAASGARIGPVNDEIRGSRLLSAIDGALPGGADRVLETFNALVDSSKFPQYLEPFAQEHINDVPTPSSRVLDRPGVQAAYDSVVKVTGAATSCGRTLEGSGFVYAAGLVMTNAHVVAGVSRPTVSLGDSSYPAEVVYYDPDIDVAVLAVPGLTAPPLQFGQDARSADPAVVLGFPENGPFDEQPARIRDHQTLRSPDIYGDGTVLRDTYSVYALVRQGNSGGPLVDPQGDVIGVIFAASLTDANTGYALSADQVAGAARAGSSSNAPADTGSCAV
ncbi:MAG: MarP family serine protease [Propionibacteriales bacterium]|nr:MarP family serine protease [Propionibacteriales bacterium]